MANLDYFDCHAKDELETAICGDHTSKFTREQWLRLTLAALDQGMLHANDNALHTAYKAIESVIVEETDIESVPTKTRKDEGWGKDRGQFTYGCYPHL